MTLIETPIGPLEIQNAEPTDECFSHEALGTLNITKAWAMVREFKAPLVKLPISVQLLNTLKMEGVDEAKVAQMSVKDRNKPVLFFQYFHDVYLIDGAPIVIKRHRHGLRHVRGHIIREGSLRDLQVQVLRHDPNGLKVPIDWTTLQIQVENLRRIRG